MSTDDPEETVDSVFEEFWRDLVCHPDGSLDVEQVKKELHDFHFVMAEAAKVYDHVTGGRVSKVMTYAHAVIEEAEAWVERQIESSREDPE